MSLMIMKDIYQMNIMFMMMNVKFNEMKNGYCEY